MAGMLKALCAGQDSDDCAVEFSSPKRRRARALAALTYTVTITMVVTEGAASVEAPAIPTLTAEPVAVSGVVLWCGVSAFVI